MGCRDRNLIVITGTPGTGKTTIAKELEKLGIAKRIPQNIIEKAYVEFDDVLGVWVIDEDILEKELRKFLTKNHDNLYVFDSHVAHFAPKDKVLIYILLRCEPEILYKRLKEKGWDEYKVKANVYAEILEVIKKELKELGIDNYVEIWTDKESLESIVEKIKNLIHKYDC